MKTYLYTFVFLALCLNMQAQNAKIKGRIVETQDEKSLPMEAVSISLLTADSAFVGGCVT